MNHGYIFAAYAVSFLGLTTLIAISYVRYLSLKRQLENFQQ